MVEIVMGQTDKVASSHKLVEFFKSETGFEGKLYVGYPILYTAGEVVILDAIWVSETYGVIVFDLVEEPNIEDRAGHRDILFNKVESTLKQHPELSEKRTLLVEMEVFTFAPSASPKITFELTATNQKSLKNLILDRDTWQDPGLYNKTLSVIQSITQIKARQDRTYVKKSDSKGAIIRSLEKTIANLDSQQEDAIIQYHEGLQRIRGLAGSGKTIVLALKAANLHALNPDWKIAVTFNTRSLKDQFRELIEIFCIQKTGRKPNEDNLHIIHSWGSSKSPGIYYNFCMAHGIEYYDFSRAQSYAVSVKNKKSNTVFGLICQKALNELGNKQVQDHYDSILVDEAQDLSESFLNICYKLLKSKKRLIYAYDELQKLNEGSSLRNPKDIFNKEAKDIILQRCYRNSRPVLVTAHALGFGIYRDGGLAQFFDQPQLWKDLGYKIREGEMKAGEQVTLYRDDEPTHELLFRKQEIDEIIQFKHFSTKEEQALEVANQIKKNIQEDELLYNDIIIINPMAMKTREEVAAIRLKLDEFKIRSHIAGDANPDYFFEKNSIAFTGINRAKGNEVPMVYIINAQECFSHPIFEDLDLLRRRNILFTAITRSKAWVRVYGTGARMEELVEEFNRVKEKDFELNFTYPTQTEIDQMNIIRRDLSTEEEKVKIDETNVIAGFISIVDKINKGEARIEDYPKDKQSILRKLIGN